MRIPVTAAGPAALSPMSRAMSQRRATTASSTKAIATPSEPSGLVQTLSRSRPGRHYLVGVKLARQAVQRVGQVAVVDDGEAVRGAGERHVQVVAARRGLGPE